jgi:hypothetical protein
MIVLSPDVMRLFKKATSIPLNEGATTRIRKVAASYPFSAALGHSYTTSSMKYEGLLGITSDALVNYMLFCGLYVGMLKQ